MRVSVYVDGFNLYYGVLKGTNYKWLDLEMLASRVLPPYCELVEIKYFSAKVSALPHDPTQPQRQEAYLDALSSISILSIYLGKFLSHPKMMPLVKPDPFTGRLFAEVIKTEEKGSDVNLATHLLVDAAQDKYDQALIISNDSDFVEPVSQTVNVFKKKVAVLAPVSPLGAPSVQLRKNATFFWKLKEVDLRAAQFPDEVMSSKGRIQKPGTW